MTSVGKQETMTEAVVVEHKLDSQDLSETECSSTLSLTSSFGAEHPKAVSFSDVEIREYKVILGDNPANSTGGPPVQIDWTPLSSCTLSVDDHQASRDDDDKGRPKSGGKSTPAQRISYLLEEYSSMEIQQAQTEARRIKQFRFQHKKEGFESFRILLEKAGRKCRKKKPMAPEPGSAEEWVQRYKLAAKEKALSGC